MEAEVWTVIEVVVDGQVIDRRVVDRRSSSPPSPATPPANHHAEKLQPEKLRITDAPEGQARQNTELPGPAPAGRPIDLTMLRQVEIAREFGEVWEGFCGLSNEQVCEMPQLRAEVLQLQAMGVKAPIEVVLQFGPPRVCQVRKWVAEQPRKGITVSNPAGLLLSVLKKGEPRTLIKKGFSA